MRIFFFLSLCIVLSSCKQTNSNTELQEANSSVVDTVSFDSVQIGVTTFKDEGAKDFREFKVLDSKYLTVATIWSTLETELEGFSEADHDRLKPLIFEQDIPTIQNHLKAGRLSYEELVKFYLFRIRKYDRENPFSLNSVIALNPHVLDEARKRDKTNKANIEPYSVYGIPILLKDNVNAEGMATTAGAVALKDNFAKNAFIVNKLKSQGALILGKANLSEWAYFFCGDCPSGYSAIGGQTLNPYGRRHFDTGGSSSGSGVAIAANLAAAAIGSETSGSILSPSSQNSIVGLKPTIGLVSRSGIVPISSTLDTAGPMTKNVVDTAILLSTIHGFDAADAKSKKSPISDANYFDGLSKESLKGKRFGAVKRFMDDTLYVQALDVLRQQGAEVVELDAQRISLDGFRSLLNLDMRKDLPVYLSKYANKDIKVTDVQDVIDFNAKDTLLRAPYGQKLFVGIVNDAGDQRTLDSIKTVLHTRGKTYFETLKKEYRLDAFLSINNYHASYAAVAEYPAVTIPMGYDQDGKPKGLTFIGDPFTEKTLLAWAYGYEQASKMRRSPKNYD